MTLLALVACVGSSGEDFDGDGVRTPEDCDDQNAFVYPGAFDTPYDGIDQDCSGEDAEDGDGDGFSAEVDCDDRAPDVYPGAPDTPYDGIDADCGGGSDFDADGDGSDALEYGGQDCDDTDPSRSTTDADQDGYTSCAGDCDDSREAVYPGATRVCGNGVDDDCDGAPECGLSGSLDFDGLDALIEGLTAGDYAGHTLSVVDDLDGDGRQDLAVGAYQAYGGNGAVHVVTRPRDGTLAQDHSLLVGSGSFGWSVAPLPGGVIVGSLTGSDFEWRGAVYVFDAPLAQVMDERDARLVMLGQADGDRAGWAVEHVDSGASWIAVGAVSQDATGSESGAVYFVPSGWTGVHDLSEVLRVRGTTTWGRAGHALAATPDVDGDGFGDLWVGEPGGDLGAPLPGSVHLLTSIPSVTVGSLGISMIGEVGRDQFGASIATGDANGDGEPDLLVGAPFNDQGGDSAGAAYLFLGPHTTSRSAGAADLVVRGRAGYEVGMAVELVDLDGDGDDDVVVGGPGANADNGGLAVFSSGQLGVFDVLDGDAIVSGTLGSRTGVAIAGGHLDGGAAEDAAVGADRAFGTNGEAGAVSVAWGRRVVLSEREQRATEVMAGALDGVRLQGRVLAVNVSDGVVAALRESGLEVLAWDRWGTAGKSASALPHSGPFERVCMRLPKGRETLRAMVGLATTGLVPEGRLWLYGANDEGIKSAPKHLKEYFDHSESVDMRRHCRVIQASGPVAVDVGLESFRKEVTASVAGREVRFATLPGVFAHGRLDDGTRLLLEHLSVPDDASVLDFGCGAGVVAAFLGERTGSLTGIDIDAWAIECARSQSGTYIVGDGLGSVEGTFGHIVSNPPFHTGKDTDFGVMDALIAKAGDRLEKGGRLTFVCPATAPVKRALDEAFSSVELLADDRRYRVWEAR